MSFFSRIFSSSPQHKIVLPFSIETSSDGTSPLMGDGAMRVVTVYACVRLIADTIGTLPIHVKRRMPDGSRITIYDHPVARLLNRPSPLIGRIDLLRAIISSEELRGNGYGYISKRDAKGYPTRIDYYLPDEVSIMAGNEDVYYDIAPLGKTVPSCDVIHFRGHTNDGIEGISPISLLRDDIENCRNTTLYSKDLYKRDLRTSGVFSTEKSLDEDGVARLFKDLSKMLRKAKTTGAPIILEEGMKYTPVTLSPEDAQFVSTKLQCIDQVAAAFRVPPHKVGDLTRGTYSNNEQGNIEFYIDCIRPKIEQLEEELNSKLFLESEKAEYYIDIDFRGLFRADTATRKDWYKELYYIGVFSPNEIRALEDMPPYEGGDQHYVPVNMTTPSNLENINQNGKSE